jgi:branched-chain amino acid transport system permease protein
VLDFLLYIVTVGAIYGLVAISLNLQAGLTGLINFGNVAFFGVGAYSSGIVAQHGGNWALGVVVGLVLAALLGVAFGRLGKSLAADYWAIVTLAVAECLRLIAMNESAVSGGPQGISGIGGPFSHLAGLPGAFLWMFVVLVLLATAYLLVESLTKMQFGRVLRLIREQPLMAESLGHNVTGSKVRALIVAAPLAALGGSLYTLYISFIGPDQLLPLETFLVFTMLVLGGIGNNKGAILGAFVVQLIYSGSRFLKDFLPIPPERAGSIRILLIGLTLTGFLLFKSQGLLPEKARRFGAEG